MIQGKYYEEFQIGDKFITPGKTITESMITLSLGIGGFIIPFFQDVEYAKKTIFKGIVAPAHLTLLILGGLVEQTGIFHETVVALTDIKGRFTAPVREGDTIKAEVELTAKNDTSSAKIGLVTLNHIVKNQRDEVVAEVLITHLVKRLN
ncbi:MAG: MaoC/PaaZ C-terminal domain-containing protein [Dehalococcoidia bacterium]|nr:MaoC/PaaZ C-terminal domain-containing protein [Dehalococcoidia bacterium]MDZ4247132.1 MaoC/PaaZ C-terminal domain-containing protein [Dehalococcoidia bacterium]